MPKGGARNRSGPRPDENSGRSDARGVVFTALPAEGYKGEPPTFPLPQPTDREFELWASVWRTPQAVAWSVQPWRHYVVGQWVRWSVRAEARDATAAVVAAVIRFADQIGMTPAGLKENGWKVAVDETAAKRTAKAAPRRASARQRMKVVRDDTGT